MAPESSLARARAAGSATASTTVRAIVATSAVGSCACRQSFTHSE